MAQNLSLQRWSLKQGFFNGAWANPTCLPFTFGSLLVSKYTAKPLFHLAVTYWTQWLHSESPLITTGSTVTTLLLAAQSPWCLQLATVTATSLPPCLVGDWWNRSLHVTQRNIYRNGVSLTPWHPSLIGICLWFFSLWPIRKYRIPALDFVYLVLFQTSAEHFSLFVL